MHLWLGASRVIPLCFVLTILRENIGLSCWSFLSGCKPFDSSRARPDQSLVRWATSLIHGHTLSYSISPPLFSLHPRSQQQTYSIRITITITHPPSSSISTTNLPSIQQKTISTFHPLLLSETSFTISPHLLPSHLASFSLTTTPTNLLSVLISVTKTDTPFVEQLAIVSILLPIITLPQQPQLLTPKSLFSPHAHITSHLHHPNVTELVGYCSEHGQHLLAYEFHKNGSLHHFLHVSDEFSKPLIWNSRVKIALGTSRALEYLHEVCSPSVVHKNIKSANILLDTELNPHLSDCGLASYIPNAEQILNHNVGSGYDAPEVALSGQYTFKSDIYSFRVVMLELLSDRKPFDSSRARPDQSLVRWATPQLHDIDALAKMVDPALKGLYPVKSLSRFADVIALCAQPEPEFRPPMSEVVQALVRLVQRANMSRRTTFGSDHGGSLRGSDDPAIRDVQIGT